MRPQMSTKYLRNRLITLVSDYLVQRTVHEQQETANGMYYELITWIHQEMVCAKLSANMYRLVDFLLDHFSEYYLYYGDPIPCKNTDAHDLIAKNRRNKARMRASLKKLLEQVKQEEVS